MFKLRNIVVVLAVAVLFALGVTNISLAAMTPPQVFESPLLPTTGSEIDLLNAVKTFLIDYAIKTLVGLIFLDVALGSAAALRTGEFEFDVFVQFYKTMVLPDLLGYLALALIDVLLPDLIPDYLAAGSVPDTVMTGFVGLVFATITARLVKSVVKNVRKLWGDLPLPSEV